VVPLHATRHHHGWRGPNPRGFTRRGEIHAWFEGTLVTGIDAADVRPGPDARQTMRSVPVAVRAALEDSLALVPELYEAERRSAAGDDAPARALVRRRLVAGATLLASLWHTAWVRSAP